MTSQIQELKDEVIDLLITLRELEPLEDYDGVDYDEIVTDIKWGHHQCKIRLQNLMEAL
jgi:hypothetical protein